MGQRQKQEAQIKDHCSSSGQRYGGLASITGSGSGVKLSGFEYSLQVDITDFAVGLEVRYERKKSVKDEACIN